MTKIKQTIHTQRVTIETRSDNRNKGLVVIDRQFRFWTTVLISYTQ